MTTAEPSRDLSDLLPRPETILPRLAQAAREVRTLRGLLRLAREHAGRDTPPATPALSPVVNHRA